MGTITLKKLQEHAIGNTFIETGSQEGWTFPVAKKYGFTRIIGIELHEPSYNFSLEKFGNTEGLEVYLGESPDILAELCPKLTEPATFWLDAHASGPNLPGGKYGICPLLQELQSIDLSPCKTHTVLVDDIRLFGTDEWDKLSLSEFLDEIYKINSAYKIIYIDGEDDGTFPNDILVAKI